MESGSDKNHYEGPEIGSVQKSNREPLEWRGMRDKRRSGRYIRLQNCSEKLQQPQINDRSWRHGTVTGMTIARNANVNKHQTIGQDSNESLGVNLPETDHKHDRANEYDKVKTDGQFHNMRSQPLTTGKGSRISRHRKPAQRKDSQEGNKHFKTESRESCADMYDASAEESEATSIIAQKRDNRMKYLELQSDVQHYPIKEMGIQRAVENDVRSRLPVTRDRERAAYLGNGCVYISLMSSHRQAWKDAASTQEASEDSHSMEFPWKNNRIKKSRVELCHQRVSQNKPFACTLNPDYNKNEVMSAYLGKNYMTPYKREKEKDDKISTGPGLNNSHKKERPECNNKPYGSTSDSLQSVTGNQTESDRNMSSIKVVDEQINRNPTARKLKKSLLCAKSSGNFDMYDLGSPATEDFTPSESSSYPRDEFGESDGNQNIPTKGQGIVPPRGTRVERSAEYGPHYLAIRRKKKRRVKNKMLKKQLERTPENILHSFPLQGATMMREEGARQMPSNVNREEREQDIEDEDDLITSFDYRNKILRILRNSRGQHSFNRVTGNAKDGHLTSILNSKQKDLQQCGSPIEEIIREPRCNCSCNEKERQSHIIRIDGFRDGTRFSCGDPCSHKKKIKDLGERVRTEAKDGSSKKIQNKVCSIAEINMDNNREKMCENMEQPQGQINSKNEPVTFAAQLAGGCTYVQSTKGQMKKSVEEKYVNRSQLDFDSRNHNPEAMQNASNHQNIFEAENDFIELPKRASPRECSFTKPIQQNLFNDKPQQKVKHQNVTGSPIETENNLPKDKQKRKVSRKTPKSKPKIKLERQETNRSGLLEFLLDAGSYITPLFASPHIGGAPENSCSTSSSSTDKKKKTDKSMIKSITEKKNETISPQENTINDPVVSDCVQSNGVSPMTTGKIPTADDGVKKNKCKRREKKRKKSESATNGSILGKNEGNEHVKTHKRSKASCRRSAADEVIYEMNQASPSTPTIIISDPGLSNCTGVMPFYNGHHEPVSQIPSEKGADSDSIIDMSYYQYRIGKEMYEDVKHNDSDNFEVNIVSLQDNAKRTKGIEYSPYGYLPNPRNEQNIDHEIVGSNSPLEHNRGISCHQKNETNCASLDRYNRCAKDHVKDPIINKRPNNRYLPHPDYTLGNNQCERNWGNTYQNKCDASPASIEHFDRFVNENDRNKIIETYIHGSGDEDHFRRRFISPALIDDGVKHDSMTREKGQQSRRRKTTSKKGKDKSYREKCVSDYNSTGEDGTSSELIGAPKHDHDKLAGYQSRGVEAVYHNRCEANRYEANRASKSRRSNGYNENEFEMIGEDGDDDEYDDIDDDNDDDDDDDDDDGDDLDLAQVAISESLQKLFTALDAAERLLKETEESMKRQHREGNIYRLLGKSAHEQNDKQPKSKEVNTKEGNERETFKYDSGERAPRIDSDVTDLEFVTNYSPTSRSRNKVLENIISITKSDSKRGSLNKHNDNALHECQNISNIDTNSGNARKGNAEDESNGIYEKATIDARSNSQENSRNDYRYCRNKKVKSHREKKASVYDQDKRKPNARQKSCNDSRYRYFKKDSPKRVLHPSRSRSNINNAEMSAPEREMASHSPYVMIKSRKKSDKGLGKLNVATYESKGRLLTKNADVQSADVQNSDSSCGMPSTLLNYSPEIGCGLSVKTLEGKSNKSQLELPTQTIEPLVVNSEPDTNAGRAFLNTNRLFDSCVSNNVQIRSPSPDRVLSILDLELQDSNKERELREDKRRKFSKGKLYVSHVLQIEYNDDSDACQNDDDEDVISKARTVCSPCEEGTKPGTSPKNADILGTSKAKKRTELEAYRKTPYQHLKSSDKSRLDEKVKAGIERGPTFFLEDCSTTLVHDSRDKGEMVLREAATSLLDEKSDTEEDLTICSNHYPTVQLADSGYSGHKSRSHDDRRITSAWTDNACGDEDWFDVNTIYNVSTNPHLARRNEILVEILHDRLGDERFSELCSQQADKEGIIYEKESESGEDDDNTDDDEEEDEDEDEEDEEEEDEDDEVDNVDEEDDEDGDENDDEVEEEEGDDDTDDTGKAEGTQESMRIEKKGHTQELCQSYDKMYAVNDKKHEEMDDGRYLPTLTNNNGNGKPFDLRQCENTTHYYSCESNSKGQRVQDVYQSCDNHKEEDDDDDDDDDTPDEDDDYTDENEGGEEEADSGETPCRYEYNVTTALKNKDDEHNDRERDKKSPTCFDDDESGEMECSPKYNSKKEAPKSENKGPYDTGSCKNANVRAEDEEENNSNVENESYDSEDVDSNVEGDTTYGE